MTPSHPVTSRVKKIRERIRVNPRDPWRFSCYVATDYTDLHGWGMAHWDKTRQVVKTCLVWVPTIGMSSIKVGLHQQSSIKKHIEQDPHPVRGRNLPLGEAHDAHGSESGWSLRVVKGVSVGPDGAGLI